MQQKQTMESDNFKKDDSLNEAYNTIHNVENKLNIEMTKSKKLDLKLRQLQFTKLKDLTREVKEKDKQINLLNARVSTFIGGGTQSLKKDRLSISYEQNFRGNSRARIKSSNLDYE